VRRESVSRTMIANLPINALDFLGYDAVANFVSGHHQSPNTSALETPYTPIGRGYFAVNPCR